MPVQDFCRMADQLPHPLLAVLDCIITSAHGLGLTEPDRQDLSRLKDPQPHQEEIA